MDVFSDIQDAPPPYTPQGGESHPVQQDVEFEPLSTILAERGFCVMSTPFIVTKEKMSEWLVKHLSLEIDTIYTVGWRETEDPFYISFSRLLDKVHTSRNSLFIIEDLTTFVGYMGEINMLGHTNNFFLIITDVFISPISQDLVGKYWPTSVDLWPAPLDIPIDIIYSRKTNLISGGQLRDYNAHYIGWRKLSHDSYDKLDPPDSLFGHLNVYLDSKVPSIESVTKDIAVQRAPKFRDIIQSVLFHNKKRHFISMIPGERGITAFESLYGKIDMTDIPIHVIRSSDPLRVKEDKIENINSNNAPLVVLSDFKPTQDMAIKNVDYYHITNGGKRSDIISILSLLKGPNYTGTYPRKLHVNNYITETPTSDLPVDSLMEKEFSGRFTTVMQYDKISRAGDNQVVFLEDRLNVVLD